MSTKPTTTNDDWKKAEYDRLVQQIDRKNASQVRRRELGRLISHTLLEFQSGEALAHEMGNLTEECLNELCAAFVDPAAIMAHAEKDLEQRIEAEVQRRIENMKQRAKAERVEKNGEPRVIGAAAPKAPKAKRTPAALAPVPAPASSPLPAPAAKIPTQELDARVLNAAQKLPAAFAIGDVLAAIDGVSRGQVAGSLERLVEAGDLQRAGKGRGTVYSLAKNPAAQSEDADDDDADEDGDLEDQLDRALAKGDAEA